jgi:hypothetical protein
MADIETASAAIARETSSYGAEESKYGPETDKIDAYDTIVPAAFTTANPVHR